MPCYGDWTLREQVIQQYVLECVRYDALYQNAKYTVMEMLTKRRHPDHLKVRCPQWLASVFRVSSVVVFCVRVRGDS